MEKITNKDSGGELKENNSTVQEIGMEEMEQVAGGSREYDCQHEFVFVECVKDTVRGSGKIERYRKCGCKRVVWD